MPVFRWQYICSQAEIFDYSKKKCNNDRGERKKTFKILAFCSCTKFVLARMAQTEGITWYGTTARKRLGTYVMCLSILNLLLTDQSNSNSVRYTWKKTHTHTACTSYAETWEVCCLYGFFSDDYRWCLARTIFKTQVCFFFSPVYFNIRTWTV